MTGSTIALIVCVAAIWMAQRLLTIWQSLRFRRQLIALREHGKLSVGMAKKIGRRVFVGLTVDQHGVVTANLVLRGVTVFAVGKPNAALIGCRATDLAAGRTPPGVPPMVAAAAVQAASFLIKKAGAPPAKSSRPTRRPVPTAA
jgi:DNA-binding transcriptional regulator of glucitol operon